MKKRSESHKEKLKKYIKKHKIVSNELDGKNYHICPEQDWDNKKGHFWPTTTIRITHLYNVSQNTHASTGVFLCVCIPPVYTIPTADLQTNGTILIKKYV